MLNIDFFVPGKKKKPRHYSRIFLEFYGAKQSGRRKRRKDGRKGERKTSPHSLPKQTEALNADFIKQKNETYRSHCPTCFHALCLSGWGLSWTGLTGRSCGLTWHPCPKVSWHALGTSLLHFQYQHLTLHWESNLCGGAPFPHKMSVLFELLVHKLLTALG